MADAKQLKQDLAALEAATAELSDGLDSAYQEYFTALGQSLRRQAVSACYSLCTQGYPGQFLALTFDRREQLQQAIQQAIAHQRQGLANPDALLAATEARRHEVERAAREAADAVLEALEAASEEGSADKLETIVVRPAPAQAELDLGLTVAAAQRTEPPAEGADAADSNEVKASDEEGGATAVEPSEGAGPEAPLAEMVPPDELDVAQEDSSPHPDSEAAGSTHEPESVTPLTLLDQWERIDSALTYSVEDLTDELNSLLREAKIIPQEMPEAVLEAILKAGSAEVVNAPPNVLNLVIHTEEYEGSGPIMAVRLQIAELEFNDTALSAVRSRLRERHSALKKLSRRYETYQHERMKLDAEAAWRAAWHDLT